MPEPHKPHFAAGEDERTRWIGADSILFATQHRPWPPPMAPWVITQRWNDVLSLHYAVAPEILRSFVPAPLRIDTFQQTAWLTISTLWLNHLRPPGVPFIPWVSHFSEIDVRTYVTYEDKPGICFLSLDASSLSAVWGARIFYRLPYWRASMKVSGRGKSHLQMQSKRTHGPMPAELKVSYQPSGAPFRPRPGSLEHFLTERYCTYSSSPRGLYRTNIHHLPWSLQAVDASIALNTMTATAGIELPAQPDVMHFSRELTVLVWAPQRLT